MRPLAVRTRVRSTPCCSASLRASGDALIAAAGPPAATGGAGTAPVVAALAAGITGADATAAPASPAAKTTAIVRPTGTTSPSRALTSRSTPEAGASSSTVTLSVSISTTGSPFPTVTTGRSGPSDGMVVVVGIRSSALEAFPRGGQRPLDSRGVDVQMRDRANQARPRRAHAHTPSEQALDGHRRRQLAGQLEEDDVGLDRRRIEADAGQAGQTLGEPPSVGVILGETLHVMAKGVHAAGRDDAGLAHRAAHLLL